MIGNCFYIGYVNFYNVFITTTRQDKMVLMTE